MRYRTLKNMERAVKLIMEKGYDHDTANDVAIHIFDIVSRRSPPVEHYIGLLITKEEQDRRRQQIVKIDEFKEHELTISGEKHDLLYLANLLREAEGTVGDLRYQIEYAFDVDGVRSTNTESVGFDDPDYADMYLKRRT